MCRSSYLFLALLLALLTQSSSSIAQTKVEGRGFNLVLKTLLSHSVPEITADSSAAKRDSYLFLDSRESQEYSVSRIEGSLNVGYDTFHLDSVAEIDKETPIIVYCSVGYRSEKIAELLLEAGFTNVQNLYGGIFEWINQGHEIYDSDGATERVHVYSRTWGVWCDSDDKVVD